MIADDLKMLADALTANPVVGPDTDAQLSAAIAPIMLQLTGVALPALSYSKYFESAVLLGPRGWTYAMQVLNDKTRTAGFSRWNPGLTAEVYGMLPNTSTNALTLCIAALKAWAWIANERGL